MSRVGHKLLIPGALLVLAFALPSAAQASASAVIRDCAQDGHLDGHYSNAELRQARDNLPSDLAEYSDCGDVIGAAITSGGSGGGHRGTGPPPAVRHHHARAHGATPRKRVHAIKPGRPRLDLGGRVIEPGKNGLFKPSSSTHRLPLPLLLALIAGGLMATVLGLMALRRRLPALSNLSLPRVSFPRLRR
jgi:hypothetical protein